MQKTIWILFVLVFTSVLSISAQQRFVANLSGAQMVPATNSTAGGRCYLILNAAGTQAAGECQYGWLTSDRQFAWIRNAPIGANGPALFSSAAGGAPFGFFNIGLSLSPEQLNDLRANRFYVVISSMIHPAGEIRGQFRLANGTYNDFDGDGRTDLTVYRNSNNTFYSRSSLAGTVFEKQLGQPGDSVSLTVDFDGDGFSDFSTARYNAEVLWRIFKSTTGTLEETRWGSSTLGDFFAAADYDGDGAFDIAVFRAGVWHIIESSTGNYRYEFFGRSGDVPAPNDFDKDGKADLAVARSEGGLRHWFVRRSSDGQVYQLQWGISSDAFFTGRSDWDGDGAADISVIRNESGQRVFYILRSSDQQFQIIRWGLSSDVVKLGDYDGDGKTDAAVTRAVNGQRVFYILQSSNGEPRYETFGLQGDF